MYVLLECLLHKLLDYTVCIDHLTDLNSVLYEAVTNSNCTVMIFSSYVRWYATISLQHGHSAHKVRVHYCSFNNIHLATIYCIQCFAQLVSHWWLKNYMIQLDGTYIYSVKNRNSMHDSHWYSFCNIDSGLRNRRNESISKVIGINYDKTTSYCKWDKEVSTYNQF